MNKSNDKNFKKLYSIKTLLRLNVESSPFHFKSIETLITVQSTL